MHADHRFFYVSIENKYIEFLTQLFNITQQKNGRMQHCLIITKQKYGKYVIEVAFLKQFPIFHLEIGSQALKFSLTVICNVADSQGRVLIWDLQDIYIKLQVRGWGKDTPTVTKDCKNIKGSERMYVFRNNETLNSGRAQK